MVIFTWDEGKRRENLKKHRVDFQDGLEMFEGPMLVRVDAREDYGEDRFLGYGFIQGMLMAMVFTEPAPDTIRVISLRRANNKEQAYFEKEIRN